MSAPTPSAETQLAFLTKIQRLFAEGDFTATYKFALLVTLADLAVELGADDGAALPLSNRQIAERFIQLYWRHAVPYGTSGNDTASGVLIQNAGTQAAVLTAIAKFRAVSRANTVQQARTEPAYRALLSKVATVVSAQPLNYLQNFGGITDPFLYERAAPGHILLKPGVAYCLRRFYPLVQQLCRVHWVDHIKGNRQNHEILGDAGDLEDFLFSISRQSLTIIGSELLKLDGPKCFYCGLSLQDAEVDHFVPFSLYTRDVAHNFVLAHATCNRSKSDSLAGSQHLEKWLERLTSYSSQLDEIGFAAGVPTSRATAHRVAAWGYGNAQSVGARAWVKPLHYELVDDRHRDLLVSR
ncbi:HNH endonuclease [Pigmentiphaga aceris]|uniref:HNH endonuclease n=1 Tax=Pigmentiphaga aceris TaxID=1940612 RepID=A0A5C0AX14_9BURK|nr:HNH endonuclease [Pigmentiphaga aceris]QEI06316.1 HNH endonuclease [Pigmentiphaga aceris]